MQCRRAFRSALEVPSEECIQCGYFRWANSGWWPQVERMGNGIYIHNEWHKTEATHKQ